MYSFDVKTVSGFFSRQQFLIREPAEFNYLIPGTGSGRVIKAINAKSSDDIGQVKTVVIEELQVFGHKTVIKDLKVVIPFFQEESLIMESLVYEPSEGGSFLRRKRSNFDYFSSK